MTAPAPLRASFAMHNFKVFAPYSDEYITLDAEIGLVAQVDGRWKEIKNVGASSSSMRDKISLHNEHGLSTIHTAVAEYYYGLPTVAQLAGRGRVAPRSLRKPPAGVFSISDALNTETMFVCRNAWWMSLRLNDTLASLARSYIATHYGAEHVAGWMRDNGSIWRRRMWGLREATKLLIAAGIDVERLYDDLASRSGWRNLMERAIRTDAVAHLGVSAARYGAREALLDCVEVVYGIVRSVDVNSLLAALDPGPVEAALRIEE